MDSEDYYRWHLTYYFIVCAIGGIFIYIGNKLPTYNENTGEVVTTYSLPFIVLGIVFIVLAFIGIIFFLNVDEEEEDK